ncbi:hypothetical protein P7K49_032524 [Saguinus oedipus]|uniref:Uncharacterized protein n=1 Tax=Saguinus oedipus TaxID=9490 RepID=A0ABQ9TZP2_SAGOE|nr:hypothetical protein P7K49_032524 [Saguinus oedipus]
MAWCASRGSDGGSSVDVGTAFSWCRAQLCTHIERLQPDVAEVPICSPAIAQSKPQAKQQVRGRGEARRAQGELRKSTQKIRCDEADLLIQVWMEGEDRSTEPWSPRHWWGRAMEELVVQEKQGTAHPAGRVEPVRLEREWPTDSRPGGRGGLEQTATLCNVEGSFSGVMETEPDW